MRFTFFKKRVHWIPRRKLVFVRFLMITILVIIGLFFVVSSVLFRLGVFGMATVSGKIENDNRPVPYVTVMVGGQEGLSDLDGSFVIKNVDFGFQSINTVREQFKGATKRVFVWRKNQNIGSINLSRATGFSGVYKAQIIDNFDDRPVEGALVLVGGASAVSDSEGRVVFQDISTGTKKVKISAVGYEDKFIDVGVGEGDVGEQTISLSPYGRVSFTSSRNGKRSVYTIRYDGTDEKNITGRFAGDTWGGKITPDGRGLVFYGNFDASPDQWGVRRDSLYFLDLTRDESPPRKISGSTLPSGDFVITRDSKAVVFLARDSKETPEIFWAGIEDFSDFRQITNNDVFESEIAVSGDAGLVAYSVFEDGARDIFVSATKGFEVKRITQNTDYEFDMTFTSDGSSLVFVQESTDLGSRIVILDLEKNESRELFRTTQAISSMFLQQGGEKVLFSAVRDGRNILHSIAIDGGVETRLYDSDLDLKNSVWPAVSRVALLVTRTDTGLKLQVMDLTKRLISDLATVDNEVISWADR